MGLFSSSSSSKSQTVKTTTTTNTETNVGDIGFTGAQGLEYAKEAGEIVKAGITSSMQSSALVAGNINNLIQAVGDNYNTLIGGSNALIQTGAEQSITLTKETAETLKTIVSGTFGQLGELTQAAVDFSKQTSQQTQDILSTAQSTANPALSLAEGSQKIMIYAIIAIALIMIAKGGF